MGLVYLPSITMVNTYFERKRGVVVGVVTSGSGIGLLVLAVITDVLIHEYGWRGCYLVVSGLVLNLCVCASLMRPLADNYRFGSRRRRHSSSCSSLTTGEEGEEEEREEEGEKGNGVSSTKRAGKVNAKFPAIKGEVPISSQPLLAGKSADASLDMLSRLGKQGHNTAALLPQFKSSSLQQLEHECSDVERSRREDYSGVFKKDGRTLEEVKQRSLSLSLGLRLDVHDKDLEPSDPLQGSGNGEDAVGALQNGEIQKCALCHACSSDVSATDPETSNVPLLQGEFKDVCQEEMHQTISSDVCRHNRVVTAQLPATVQPFAESVPKQDCYELDAKTTGQPSVVESCQVNSLSPSSHPQRSIEPHLHNGQHQNHHQHRYHIQPGQHHHDHHHHHHHHNHHQHQQHPEADSHLTIHDLRDEGVSVTEPTIPRPTIALHKRALTNILPEFLGSMSTLSVSTARTGSVRSLRSRSRASSLRHPATLTAGSSHETLARGSRLTLQGKSCGAEAGGEGLDAGSGEIEVDYRGQTAEYSSLGLFKIASFDLFCLGAFLVQIAGTVPTMFAPSFVVSAGLSASASANIVSVIGLSNTGGRLVAGLLSYLGVGSVRVYNGGTFLAGLACFLLPLCTTFPALVAFAVGHGFFIGFFPPLQSVILVEQLGLDRLPASFGIICVCKSVASVAGPFFAGALSEWSSSYAMPFYFAGVTMMLANIVHVIMAYCPKAEDGDKQRR